MPDSDYLSLATQAMKGLKSSLCDGKFWYRTATAGQLGQRAYLADEAAIGSAALELFLTNFEAEWLHLALERADYIIEYFAQADDQVYRMVLPDQSELPVSSVSLYDNATPSGNAHTALFLQKLDKLTGPGRFGAEARRLLSLIESSAMKYPTSFAAWARTLLHERSNRSELIIAGPKAYELAKSAWADSPPHELIVCAETNVPEISLLENRFDRKRRLLYYCHNLACGLPVESLDELKGQRQSLLT